MLNICIFYKMADPIHTKIDKNIKNVFDLETKKGIINN